MYFLDVLINYKLVETLETSDKSLLRDMQKQILIDREGQGFLTIKKRVVKDYVVVSSCPDGVCPVRVREVEDVPAVEEETEEVEAEETE